MARQIFPSGGPFEPIYGYSRAVRVGDQVHVSGTAARPPHLAGRDAYAQSKNILEIIAHALSEAGSQVEDVVRTVVYVTDIGDAQAVAKAHREVFGHVLPASTLVEVSALLEPDMVVEMEAYAVVESDGK